jgi:uncharacterized membrane protein
MTEKLVEFILHYTSWLNEEIIVFIISLFPILELRGGVLAGYWLGLPLLTTSIIAVIGNLLPIPFILFFIEKILTFMEKHNILTSFIHKIRDRALHKSKGLANMEFIGLMLFVGIPLPGTGAWTGALVAETLQMDRKKAMLAITLGVFIALIIMLIVSYGVLNQIGI